MHYRAQLKGCVNAADKADALSNSSNKIHQTLGLPLGRVLQKVHSFPKNVPILPRRVLKSFMDGSEEEDEERDKNKRPRMVLSEALPFPRLDQ